MNKMLHNYNNAYESCFIVRLEENPCKKRKKIGIDLTQGSVAKVLLRFMLPFLLASVLQTLYSTVDMIVVGQYVGSIGTVAVSMGSKIANLFTMFSMAFSTAGQIYVGQQIGAVPGMM